MSIKRTDFGPHHAMSVVRGDTVYLAGFVADDKPASAYEQTKEVLAKIDRYLAEAGTDKSRILTSQVWLRDMADYDEYNRAWDEWADFENLPVRATVQTRLTRDSHRVEIMVVAAV